MSYSKDKDGRVTWRRNGYMSRSTTPLERSGIEAHPYHSITTRAGVKDELDRLTSLIVRARDKACVTCGATENLECSHYFKRRFLATRWNLQNCNAQCSTHNDLHNETPFPYRAYMVKTYGEDALDELFKLRNSVWRPTDAKLRDMLSEYKLVLKEM